MSTADLAVPSRSPALPAWAIGAGYAALFVLLDWLSFIRPLQGLNITPWSPQFALAIALLLWNRGWLWLVAASLLTAELVVRGTPADWRLTLGVSAALAFAYAAIARAVSLRVARAPVLSSRRDLLWFTAIAVGGSLLCAAVYVGSFAIASSMSPGFVAEAIARYWIGDAVGFVVVLPLLLTLMDTQRRAALAALLRRRAAWAIAGLIAALLVGVFGIGGSTGSRYAWLLLLPVVWASSRCGLPGAVFAAGLTQVGLIVAVQGSPLTDATVFELQVLMAAVAMTGLLLGVAVDEREHAQLELRSSLRLAAAGQMAAALAHELSQPLTALGSYAEASRLLAAAPALADAERAARLADVAQRMGGDAHRAAEVIKRLREFFRAGSTQLQPTDARELLAEAVDAHRRRAAASGIELVCQADGALPPDALLDRVQIAVVLRNLIANALDAASSGAAPRRVVVRAAASRGAEALRVDVLDSGPGLDATRLATLFEPGTSDKPGGMGVGLSICRAIVEAHGGRLWAEAGRSGHFGLELPLEPAARPHDAAAAQEERDAP
jgi:signal transduction histidine kinase